MSEVVDAPAATAPAVAAPAAAPVAAAPTSLLATGAAPAAAAAPETTPPEGGAPASSETAAEGAPEAYTEFALPEGVQLPADLATEFGGLAKELGLPQAQAQRVVDIAAKMVNAAQQQQVDTVTTVHKDWRAACATDKEFGGEKLGENLARAKAAMEATASPQLQVLLDRSGLGNNPEVIRHFLKVAPAFLPDTFVPGGKAPTAAAATNAQRMFPNMNP